MLQLTISLPPQTKHIRDNNLITFNIDEEDTKNELWLSEMELWLCVNGETTDTAVLQLTKDEEFEVYIDSQREHFAEGEEFYSATQKRIEYEYARLTLHPDTKEMPPMFTLIGEDIDVKEIGGELISILNRLGQSGWELACRENNHSYMMKREKIHVDESLEELK